MDVQSQYAERLAGAEGGDTWVRRGRCELHVLKRIVDGVDQFLGLWRSR